MQNLVKKIDSDLQDGARVAIPEEATEINVSEGLINVNTVLNDGQLTEEEKSNLESSACNDNGCENQDGDDDGATPRLPIRLMAEILMKMKNMYQTSVLILIMFLLVPVSLKLNYKQYALVVTLPLLSRQIYQV